MHREKGHVQVVSSTQMRMVNSKLQCIILFSASMFTLGHIPEAISPDTVIGGFSIDLPDGLNDDVKQTIDCVTEMMARATDPFQDNSLISQLRDSKEYRVTECADD